MTQSDFTQKKHDNAYVLDAESTAEMARLLDQDKFVTEAMGGIFPERDNADMEGIERILDIACGPGGWVHDVAYEYPTIEVTGIDISQRMIAYAQAHAEARKLPNAHFQVMDALRPLDFPDGSFDLVNARTIVGFMAPTQWPVLIKDCKRVLRPGGVLRFTEGEYGMANTPAYEKLWGLINKAAFLGKRGFSPTGNGNNSTLMLRRLMQQSGLQYVQQRAHALDYSAGTRLHDMVYQDYKVMFKLLKPFLLKSGASQNEAELDRLTDQAIAEMEFDDFCALSYMLTVWGQKPL